MKRKKDHSRTRRPCREKDREVRDNKHEGKGRGIEEKRKKIVK